MHPGKQKSRLQGKGYWGKEERATVETYFFAWDNPEDKEIATQDKQR